MRPVCSDTLVLMAAETYVHASMCLRVDSSAETYGTAGKCLKSYLIHQKDETECKKPEKSFPLPVSPQIRIDSHSLVQRLPFLKGIPKRRSLYQWTS